MVSGFVFASQGRDIECCREALGRVGCEDIIVIRSPDDISTDRDIQFAVVEIFDPDRAQIPMPHVANDDSPGIVVLKAIRERFPNCTVFAISHTSCVNGSNYVESKVLADRCIAIDWTVEIDVVALIESQLRRAEEAHSVLHRCTA